MKKIIFLIIIVFSLALWLKYKNNQPITISINIPEAKEHQDFVDNTNTAVEDIIMEDISDEVVEVEEIIVDEAPQVMVKDDKVNLKDESINLSVPFTSQAPSANWQQPFQDACEEASILMAVYYDKSLPLPSIPEVEDKLRDMVLWQEEHMEGTHDINITEAAYFIENYFDYKTKLVPNLTADKIRNLLLDGFPVIVPVNGHILDNPFFQGDGPDYHMIVIKGFVDDKFITNDPGTKRGQDFVYTEANLIAALADWDHEKALAVGPKMGLVIYKD